MVKKIVVLLPLWIVCFLFSSGVHTVQAVELSVESTYGVPGQTIHVSIVIDNATDVLSGDMEINYDAGVLKATGVEAAPLAADFMIAKVIGSGLIRISLAGSSALSGGGAALVVLSFTILNNAASGQSTISIPEATLYGSDMQRKPVRTKAGSVKIGMGGVACAATSALGDANPHLATLRQFRDQVLAKNRAGRKMIEYYYQKSEVFIAFCKKYPAAKLFSQSALKTIVFLINYFKFTQ
jgi:hypothetical protein